MRRLSRCSRSERINGHNSHYGWKRTALRNRFYAHRIDQQPGSASWRRTGEVSFSRRSRAGARARVHLKFINLTRRTEIGANSYYIEAGGRRLVLDCGMHPKFESDDALPNFKAIAGRQLDAILISHSHQDHIGTLPVLMRRQPHAGVFMTEATAEIGSALLHNSVNVMTRQREERGPAAAGLYPLFTHRETDRACDRWQSCALRQTYTLAGERASSRGADALTFEFFDAGHVLGSVGTLLRVEGRTVF